MLLVGDIIYNDDFDCNCVYTIYETRNRIDTCVYSTEKDGPIHKPLDLILDMKIVSLAVENNHLIIKARKNI